MIRTIVLDFDGVVLESVEIKTRAFKDLFADHPEHADAIRRYHLAHLGISRYEKFEWIYRHLLNRPLSPAESERLGKEFSRLVWERLLACPFVPGAAVTLPALARRYPLYVASGTPHAELVAIAQRRGIAPWFSEVWGAPTPKESALRAVMDRMSVRPDEIAFVGDGLTDLCAAQAVGTLFVARRTEVVDVDWSDYGVRSINDLTELPSALGLEVTS